MAITKTGSSFFVGNNSLFQNRGLKSTQERMKKQEERDNRIAYLENQKSSLKNMECDTLEEISRKLDFFHSYENQIEAAKEEYNQSQMMHVMDEARERGEQIAKAAEKNEPKTPEERREELAEEALGTDENKSEMSENMEELAELAEDTMEEMEELAELTEDTAEQMEDLPEKLLEEEMSKQVSEKLAEELKASDLENSAVGLNNERQKELIRLYKKFDIRL